jgi:hypothetical protein
VEAAEVVVVAAFAGADNSSTGRRGATASASIGSCAAEAVDVVEAGAGVRTSAGFAGAAVIDPRMEEEGAEIGATGVGDAVCWIPFGCARLKHELHMLAVLGDLKNGGAAKNSPETDRDRGRDGVRRNRKEGAATSCFWF